ncbi:MAG: hypothetical protein RLN96_06490 [Pseudomonadales bacterium]
MNLESLVTKDYLAAQFAEQNASIDKRFVEQKAYIDTRYAELKAYIDTRFSEQNANFRVITVMLSIVMLAVVIPFLERLLAL